MSDTLWLVLLFLLLTLIVGVVAGGNIKNLREYAVAGTKCSLPVLLFTMLASEIGGGLTVGAAGEVYKDGVGILLVIVGLIVGIRMVSKFVAPNFDRRFEGMISMGDIIERFYGARVEKWSVTIFAIQGILAVGGQFIALGHVLETLLGVDYNTAVLLSASVVGIYSCIGGVRAVIATDIMQLMAIVVVMTAIAIAAYLRTDGGLDYIIAEAKQYDVQAVKESLYPAIYYMLPICLLYPVHIQRFLMAKSPGQLQEVLNTGTFIMSIFCIIIMAIGLCARHFTPGVSDTDNVLPALLISLFEDDALMLGLGTIALISAILSTSDSLLNAASVLIAGRLKKNKERTKKNKEKNNEKNSEKNNEEISGLAYARLATLCLTILAMLIGFTKLSVIGITLGLLSIGCVIQLATFLGIMRLRVSAKDFWAGLIAVGITSIIGQFFFSARELPIICTVIAAVAFLTSHFIRNGCKFVWETRGRKIRTSVDRIVRVEGASKTYLVMNQLQLLAIDILIFFKTLPRRIRNWMLGKVLGVVDKLKAERKTTKRRPKELGIYISFATIALTVVLGTGVGVENPDHPRYQVLFPLIIYSIAASMFYERFWVRNSNLSSNLWILIVTFCLPFASVSQYILDGGGMLYMINIAFSFAAMMALLESAFLFLFSTLGIISAFIFCSLMGVDVSLTSDSVCLLLYAVLMASSVGILFIKPREIAIEDEHEMTEFFGSLVAHDSKTPIVAMHSEAGLLLAFIRELRAECKKRGLKFALLDKMEESAKRSIEIGRSGAKIIDDLLSRCGSGVIDTTGEREHIRLSKLVSDAFYMMSLPDETVAKISLDLKDEYDVIVNCHIDNSRDVIWNIINNGIRYALHKEGARLVIRLEARGVVEFEDTGPGMPDKTARRVFDKFFTTSRVGTGLGLSLCRDVMEEMGGDIDCYSSEGEGTTFILLFRNAVVEE